ncbi:thyroid transcription factor 1-associated protein 26 [Contarinia nasturtii]|uniref:thyroid transcription factor 1-associated protein 26 n=1 Tax=Contarinia nasturtii TaxID=265458 RepID=UPI0012D4B33B|nr:thyroid transcription factor 1-associated protein 26 [Contarinia nasturtii]
MKNIKKSGGKPVFKKDASKSKQRKNGKQGGSMAGKRNQFTVAEERRLDRIRQQNERKAEKEAKMLIIKKDKKRKLKIFSKKNTKGQPVMKGRMELLLEKIEKRIAN